MPTRQIGISPKVLGQAVATVIVWVLSFFAVQLSPEVSSAIALVLGAATGYLAPAGAVAHEHPPSASDDQLSPDVETEIRAVPPPA